MQIDFYVSHDIPFQQLSSNNSDNSDYASLRRRTESYAYSYSIGARFGFTFPSGMGIKSGLNFSSINRKFSYDTSDAPMGMDSLQTSLNGSTNKYTFIDIPLIFSYEMSGYGPFYYTINAGAMINMTFAQKGNFFDENNNIVNFSDNIQNRYRAYEMDAGTSLFASFGFHYFWNDLIDFIIEPNIRIAVAPITLDDYSLNEKYSTFGLITGFRYKF